MKIMIFMGGYLPGEKFGGPVTSIYNFTELFGDMYEIYIVCKNHDLKEKTPYTNISEGWNAGGKAKVQYLADSDFGFKRFRLLIDEISPDLIYSSSIMSAGMNIPLIRLARKKNIPLLLAPRGELNDSAIKIKAWKKKPYLWLLKSFRLLNQVCIQATSEDELKNCYKHLKISQQQAFLLPNIPSSVVHKNQIDKASGRINIVFVARILPNKNLKYAIQAVNKLQGDVSFDIYGPIENEAYWNECKEEITKAPANVKILYKGKLKPAEAREVYSKYDCLVFPTLFENYGQVIAEAISHDCPVVISKNTTPWDDINDNVAPFAAPLESQDLFVKALADIMHMDNEAYVELIGKLRRYSEKKMNISEIKQQYITMFDAIMNLRGIQA